VTGVFVRRGVLDTDTLRGKTLGHGEKTDIYKIRRKTSDEPNFSNTMTLAFLLPE
jgi:hypothetical protein